MCIAGHLSGAFAQGRLKRKMSIADSDEEIESIDAKAYKNGLSAYRPSPEHEVSNSEFVQHTLIHGRNRCQAVVHGAKVPSP